ncbi:MAG TPA: hypothetical protein VGE52_16445 [Pirellulales bacterium]
MEIELPRFTRKCSVTQREIQPGETFFSAVVPEGDDGLTWKRLDFCKEAWKGPPEGVSAWWKAKLPARETGKAKAAPNEVLGRLFVELYDSQTRPDMLYVLTLLLLRRRALRQEDEAEPDPNFVVCTGFHDDVIYRVPVVDLSAERADALQAELDALLYG